MRCKRCGLVFYFPQPSASEAAAFYSASYFAQEFPESGAKEQLRLANARLQRIEGESSIGRLLDVGCGRGRFLRAARDRGWETVGLDIAPHSVQEAAAVSQGIVLQGVLSQSRPVGMAGFDVLTLWDVLEHLTDPVGDLKQAWHWLRPGGLIVIQTQNTNSVTAAWLRRRWEQFVPFHLFHFSPRTLRLALQQAGFVDTRIDASDSFTAGLLLPAQNAMPMALPIGNVREKLRRLRDTVYCCLGYDRFNVMVATARRPRET